MLGVITKKQCLRGFGLLLASVIILDWFSKHVILSILGSHPAVYNPSGPGIAYLLLILATALAVLMLMQAPWAVWSCGLTAGGASANIIDLQLSGHVADFIHRPLSDYYFNLADLFITIGIIILVMSLTIHWRVIKAAF